MSALDEFNSDYPKGDETGGYVPRNRNDYINSLPPGVREDMLKGGKTQSIVGDAAILGASAYAVRNPLHALEMIGAVSTDAKNFNDLQQDLLSQQRKLNPIKKVKNISRGLKRISNVVSDVVNPRQVEVAGAPGLRINARDVDNPNVMRFDSPDNNNIIASGKSPLVESLPSKYRMTVEGRGLGSTVHQMLDAKEANIAKAQANFDKWDAYVKGQRAKKIKLSSKESVGYSNAKRTLNDQTSSPIKVLVARWMGERGQKGYKVIGDPNVPGGKPPKGSGLDQHHKAGSSEMFHMSEQTAMKLDREFRVNTWQYLASRDVLPGWGKANMLDLPSKPHRYELHPHMRSLGFENFWKQIPKDLAEVNPEKFYELIDQWHEEILTPSLQMADEILRKGDVKSIVITHDKLILPPQIRKIMKQKQKSILEQAMGSYKSDLKIKGAQSLPKSEIKRTFQETQRRI